jgi:4-hydroxy-3-polyprenylbenzoate decarboxylase
MSDLPCEWILGISGASGTRLALRFLELLVRRPEVDRVHVVVSEQALEVARAEAKGRVRTPDDLVALARLSPADRRKIRIHDDEAIAAPISSGSYPVGGMAIVPCSAGTLGSLAAGVSRGLLQRAADVQLKERRRLVLAFRESPLSLIHVEAIRTLTLAGAIVAPPVPAYYLPDADAETWVDASAMRLLDLLGFPPSRPELRWGKPRLEKGGRAVKGDSERKSARPRVRTGSPGLGIDPAPTRRGGRE